MADQLNNNTQSPEVSANTQLPAQAPEADSDRSHVVNEWGEVGTLPNSQLQEALGSGYGLANQDQIKQYQLQKQYGTPGQQAIAGAEAFGQGLAGPLAPAMEQAFGAAPRDILGRAEANPGTHFGFEVAGLVAPTIATAGSSVLGEAIPALSKLSQAGLLESAGKLTAKALGGAEGATTLAGKIGTGAAQAAVENMLLAGSDETSKMILNDPQQSANTALSAIGLSGLLGGALGGSLSAVSPLWDATFGHKASQIISDFKGRMAEHINNPNPVEALQSELGSYYGNIRNIADEVYGPTGLKAQDVAKAVPSELTPKITTQAEDIASTLNSSIDKMVTNQNSYPPRLTAKLQQDLKAFSDNVSKEGATSSDYFNAIQDLKQTLQGYSKFDKFVKPIDEAYDFVNDAKKLAFDIRTKLEDTGVWGKAAERQQSINKAFTQYLPTLEDFESKFTTKVAGERVIDPGKVNTYMNQLGKPSAEIKQSMLKNFLDASDKYQKVITDTHANLGLESPVQYTPTNAIMNTLNKPTTGGRLADMFIKRGLTDAGGQAVGATIGGTLSHAVGMNAGIGAVIGQHALGPFFSSVLPALAKPLLKNAQSAQGFKAATDYAVAVAKGESLLNKSIKNIFKEGVSVLSDKQSESLKDTTKLEKQLQKYREDPQAMFNSDYKTGYYLPDHSEALNQTAMNGINYLNGIAAKADKKSPLDPQPVLSSVQKAQTANAMQIANQPMVVLDKIKRGTITSRDISTLNALYPQLYTRMQQKVMDEIVTAEQKNRIIPYKTKVALSLFMGKPLDSSLLPDSMISNQLATASGKQAAAQQQAPQKGVKSSPALQKMPNNYKTPTQARIERQNKV